MPSPRKSAAPPAVAPTEVDTRYLESLVGYNARRASLAIIEVFMERMAVYGLTVVDFSVLSLVAHNPGITSRQLCTALGILPPNLVGLIAALEVDATARLTERERATLIALLRKVYGGGA